jgi:hypothetical protein
MLSTENKDEKKIVSKEKLRTIMEAASALTALGDEDSSGESRAGSPHMKDAVEDSKQACTAEEKRFLPDYKKPDAAVTFPEKVCSLSALHPQGSPVWIASDGCYLVDDENFGLRSHHGTACTGFLRSLYPGVLFFDIFDAV